MILSFALIKNHSFSFFIIQLGPILILILNKAVFSLTCKWGILVHFFASTLVSFALSSLCHARVSVLPVLPTSHQSDRLWSAYVP